MICTFGKGAERLRSLYFVLTFDLNDNLVATFNTQRHDAQDAGSVYELRKLPVADLGKPDRAAGFLGTARKERGRSSVKPNG